MSGLYMLLSHRCGGCGGLEERIFTDSWTGRDLCCMCLYRIVGDLTMSPLDEGDNLDELLESEEDEEEE